MLLLCVLRTFRCSERSPDAHSWLTSTCARYLGRAYSKKYRRKSWSPNLRRRKWTCRIICTSKPCRRPCADLAVLVEHEHVVALKRTAVAVRRQLPTKIFSPQPVNFVVAESKLSSSMLRVFQCHFCLANSCDWMYLKCKVTSLHSSSVLPTRASGMPLHVRPEQFKRSEPSAHAIHLILLFMLSPQCQGA